ncbi:MAG: NAD-dependent dihydropyrimidine dehydrogenase subunit PreA, partial [Rubrivivax sp.]|nr:NAD-dependent dihydropyrimidine dehydrogenase subunit PreA [Rubrivivax sp.]
MVVSLMVPVNEQSWKDILAKVADTGADGVELNFGCPHGMSERGMGADEGQVPESIHMVTAWCKQHGRLPVIVKLTPNISDIRQPAAAAKRGGADAVSLINTISSIMGVDPATLTMSPSTGGMGSHGGYCGPAVKPIALNMVAEIGRAPATAGLPISGIGGVGSWRDALDYIALGATNVQVCTAAMVYGFKIVQEMVDGLSDYMDSMGFKTTADFQGRALPTVTDWQYLNLNATSKAVIDQASCIQCGRCHIACEDTSHQAITAVKDGKRHFAVKDDECVGCNLCVTVCPVPDCITLRTLAPGEMDTRTGQPVRAEPLNWTAHPNNPSRAATA